jgi:molybdopterin-guanine dinucleotide biosynthesis protein A
VAGLVLAGGYSRRMGRDKALLEIDGRTQLARAVDTVERLGIPTYVSARQDQRKVHELSGVPVLYDGIQDGGPMAGILRAFEERPDSAWLFLAVDLAAVGASTLQQLCTARDRRAAAVAFTATDGGVEPVCSIVEPAARSAVQNAVKEERLSVRDLLRELGCKALVPTQRGAQELAINLNDKEAYQTYAGRKL